MPMMTTVAMGAMTMASASHAESGNWVVGLAMMAPGLAMLFGIWSMESGKRAERKKERRFRKLHAIHQKQVEKDLEFIRKIPLSYWTDFYRKNRKHV